ncbi:MAG TPA: LamG-like jellyroll fold domain-containing protein, partial [Candidatus Eisenbacteria bacterium]|nr:LamG-like jellyroll fold domain-containing protein [Candidatus Eisenbacteria bacterium]
LANKVGSTSQTSFVNSGVSPGSYFYLVLARDAAGNTSQPSNIAGATVLADTQAPSTPTGLAATAISESRIDLTWNASTDNVGVTGYNVIRDGIQIGTTAQTSFSNTGLTASTTYAYQVAAFDAAGNPSAPSTPPVNRSTLAAPPPSSNLVAAYAFDEGPGATTTADASGNGFTGTLVNNPTWGTGKYGAGLVFNATDDGNDANDPRVVIGRTVNVPGLPFTFSAWVNPASFTDWRAILSKRDTASSSNRRFDVGLAASSGRVYVATGATTRTFVYGAPINTWTHIAVVAEATGTKLYVNGVLRETLAAITLGANSNANTVIGGTGEGAGGDNDPFKGSLDDLRLYSRAQTAAEITTDMNTPVTAAPPAQTLPLVASQMGVSPTPPAPPVLRVFPNPFRSGTRIEARGGQDVIVFDVTGRKVRRWRSPSTLSVDWEGTDGEGRRLPAGIYFVKSGRHIVRAVLLR